MALYQRFEGRKVAPLNGVDEVMVVGHHLGQTAGGQGIQHPEAAVVGVGVLQGAPEVHLPHGGEPRLVEAGVGLVEAVEVQRLGLGQLVVGGGALTDEGTVLGGAVGRKVPQHPGLHRDALVDQLIHDVPVQPGDSGALVGHDLHKAVFLQALQHHPDEGAGRAEAGAERVFAQRAAGPQGQVDDLPLEDGVYFRIRFKLLFHCRFPV